MEARRAHLRKEASRGAAVGLRPQKLQGSQELVQEQARFLTGHSTLSGYTRHKRRVLVNAVCSFYLR